MGQGVIRVVLDDSLEGSDGIGGMTGSILDLGAIDQRIAVVGERFQNVVVELAGFLQAIFQNEQFGIVLFYLPVHRMVTGQQSVFVHGLVYGAGGEVEVAQHTVGVRVIRQITLRLLQNVFRFVFLVLC